MLVNGKWAADPQPVKAKDAKGGFVRQASTIRNWITQMAVRARPGRVASRPKPGTIISTWPSPAPGLRER